MAQAGAFWSQELMTNQLSQLSDQIAGAVDVAARHVVAVQGGRRHASSGILWQPGVVVTSDQALKHDDGLTVINAAGERMEARLAGRDGSTDLAILTLPPSQSEAVPELSQAPEPTRAGQLVLVVGRSPESGPQASMTILSAVSGAWRTWRGGKLDAYLRLDAATYPGTPGSLVVDSEGRMIGMATAALSRLAPLAVPSATISRVVAVLLRSGKIGRGFIGVGMQAVRLPRSFGIQQASALIVLSVEPESPAEQAGVIAGDILVSLDGQPTSEVNDVLAALEADRIGHTVLAQLIRGGEARQIEIRIGERP